MRASAFILTIILLIICTATVQARIIHVPGDSTTIQGGINGASTGDTVMVSPGTYYEYAIDFLGKAITVMSTDPEDSAVVAATIINGAHLGRVFYFHSHENVTSVLTGMTIMGGSAGNGGGIYCSTASPTITNNVISGNVANDKGGGIACYHASEPYISNNIIIGNSADGGGGILCDSTRPRIANNRITANIAQSTGGAIFCREGASPTIVNNLIADNSASIGGGGIRCAYSNPTIVSNLIVRNTAMYHGGGVSILNFSPLLINNTITGNTVTSGDGGGVWTSLATTITNCILWDNWPNELYPNIAIVTYSDVQGDWSGEGNINADPLFMDPSQGDYHLQIESFCVDAGDPTIFDDCIPPGLLGERSDMGAYGGEENCGWPPYPPPEFGIYLSLWASDPVIIPKGDILEFNTRILNYKERTVEGDYWLSVMTPDSMEFLISEALLNYPNPLHGQIFSFGSVELSNELWVHPRADTGSYHLIGRIGAYPDIIIDEESFRFRVVE
jgi:parallel beta-helix repeat protein